MTTEETAQARPDSLHEDATWLKQLATDLEPKDFEQPGRSARLRSIARQLGASPLDMNAEEREAAELVVSALRPPEHMDTEEGEAARPLSAELLIPALKLLLEIGIDEYTIGWATDAMRMFKSTYFRVERRMLEQEYICRMDQFIVELVDRIANPNPKDDRRPGIHTPEDIEKLLAEFKENFYQEIDGARELAEKYPELVTKTQDQESAMLASA